MYSYNYAVTGNKKNIGDDVLVDFNVIESSFVTENKNDLDLSLRERVLEKNTLELKKILDVSSIVEGRGFSYDMYGLNIMERYNRLFYRFLAESFVRNYVGASKVPFKVHVLGGDRVDYLYEHCAYLLFNNKYIQLDWDNFRAKIKDNFKKNYSSKVLLEEAIKETLFGLRETNVFNEDLDILCKDYLSNNLNYVSKKRRLKSLLEKKKEILENGYQD